MTKKEPSSRFDALFGAAKLPKPLEQDTPESEQNEVDRPAPDTQGSALSKGKDPNYQRTTVYLPKTMHRKLKAASAEEGREMSNVIEELIQQWLDRRKDV